jgi:heavy metal sensor kinase
MKPGVPRGIRTRLTLWNISVFGGILLVYAIGTGWFFLSVLDAHLDDTLKEDLELIDQMLLHAPAKIPAIDIHEGDVHELERFLEIHSGDGEVLYRSAALAGRTIVAGSDTAAGTGPFRSRSALLSDGSRIRLGTRIHTRSGARRTIHLAISEEAYFAETREFIRLLFIGIPLALAVVAGAGYVLARRALRPVDRMVAAVQQTGGRDLGGRLPVDNADDELGRLAAAFNDLLGRIEQAFDQLTRFTADASHELRTPLAALRGVGEVGLQSHRSGEEYREIIGSMLEEVDRLARLVDSLLLLSRADGARIIHRLEDIDLTRVAEEAVELTAVLADEKGQSLAVSAPGPVYARGDRMLVSQAVLNLVDNAIKFSPAGGAILVETGRTTGDRPFLRVTDDGPGIAPEEQELVFRRFYRAAAVRGSHAGSGLGLAISKWAVESQGGRMELASTPGAGASFTVVLNAT